MDRIQSTVIDRVIRAKTSESVVTEYFVQWMSQTRSGAGIKSWINVEDLDVVRAGEMTDVCRMNLNKISQFDRKNGFAERIETSDSEEEEEEEQEQEESEEESDAESLCSTPPAKRLKPNTPSPEREPLPPINMSAWESLMTPTSPEHPKPPDLQQHPQEQAWSFIISEGREIPQTPQFRLLLTRSPPETSFHLDPINTCQWAYASLRHFLLDPRLKRSKFIFELDKKGPGYNDITKHIRAIAFAKCGLVVPLGSDEKGLFLFPEIAKEGEDPRILGVIATWEEIFIASRRSYVNTLRVEKKLFLVLDLDSTLIWAVSAQEEGKIALHERAKYFQIRNSRYDMLVTFRPGVHKFLREMSALFHVFIYTAAEIEYAKSIVTVGNREGWKIPLQRIFSSAREASKRPRLKDLKNVFLRHHWSELAKGTFIVDDIPISWAPEYHDLVYQISPFCGSSADTHLRACKTFLVNKRDEIISSSSRLDS